MSKRRILFIGWDAADWKVIRPLIAAGEMPNLAGLMAGGVHGNMATIYPVLSPMLWSSIATGKRPFKHGIHGFSEPLPDGSGVRPISSLSRKTKAVWNILNQNGLKSIVVGWWPSHPAEPINGVMVSNHYSQVHGGPEDRHKMPLNTVHPTSWSEPLADLRVSPMELDGEILRMFVPDFQRVDQSKDRRLHSLGKIVAETMSIHAAATELLGKEDWDFAAVYFDAIDHFGHAFMSYHPPRQDRISEADFSIYQHVVANGYRYHDGMLGTLLRFADENTTVMLMSDHGFHPDHLRPAYIPAEPAGPAVEHRHFGIVVRRGPDIRVNERIHGATVLDACPTLLALAGLQPGRDMDGKVLLNAFRNPPQIEPVDSWDSVAGDSGMHPPEKRLDTVASAEAFKQLVELGYVAPPGANVAETVDETTRELQYNLARAYTDAGRHADAMALFKVLWERWPREHRFAAALIDSQRAAGDIPGRKASILEFESRVARYQVLAKEELAKFDAEKAAKKAVEGAAPDGEVPASGQRRDDYLRRQWLEQSHPRPLQIAWMKASQALLERDFAEARRQWEVLLASGPLPMEMGLQAVAAWKELGHVDRAREVIAQLRELDPENSEALARLAEIEMEAGNPSKAVEAATDSLALIYFQPAVHFILARSLLDLGLPVESEQAARVAVAQVPGFVKAHALLGLLYRKHLNRPADAFLHEGIAKTLQSTRRLEANKSDGKETSAPTGAPEAAAPPSFNQPASQPADPAQVITVVSGLPRSGTSMMMQILAAGGVEPLTDGIRQPDEDNPMGYHEFDPAANLAMDSSWVQQGRGKVVKVVAQLLPWLPRGEQYRVVFLRRDLREVVASQKAMLQRLNRDGAGLSDEQLMATYRKQLEGVQRALGGRPDIAVTEVDYAALLAEPEPELVRLATFLERPFDANKAAGAIRPELRRQKADGV